MSRKKKWLLRVLTFVTATICFSCVAPVVISIATIAEAHDWYPMECCHALDCAPVTNVSFTSSPTVASPFGPPPAYASAPLMIVETMHGTAVVPANFPRRESKDNRMHACMRKTRDGTMRLLCLFIPPTM